MNFIATWMPLVGAGLMVIVGLVGLLKPALMIDPLGISTSSAKGMSEVRAIFGGINLGGGLAALLLQDPAIYLALGSAWSGATLARFYSMAVDGSTLRDSIPALVVDVGLAVLLLSSQLAG